MASTYIIKQKYFTLSDKFTIYTGEGNEAYFCESKMTVFPKRFWLTDVNGDAIYFARRKMAVLFPKADIFAGNGESEEVVATVKGQLSVIRARLKVLSDEFGRYKIVGSPFARRFKITRKEGKRKILLAKIHKKMRISDEYVLDVFEGNDAFMVALCIVIDSIYHSGN